MNMLLKFAFLVLFLTLPYTMGQRCNRACLAVWRPVCAGSRNLRVQCTFSNACNLGVRQCERPREGWVKLHDGVCRSASNRCRQILST